MTSTLFDLAEGLRRKDAALGILSIRRDRLITVGRRALLLAMLQGDGTATADDVRAAVELPPGVNPSCFGAVPKALATAGIIRCDQIVQSARPQRHAGINRVWRLVDRAKALAWLADHPDPSEVTGDYSNGPVPTKNPVACNGGTYEKGV